MRQPATFSVPSEIVYKTQMHLRAKGRNRHEGVVLWRGAFEPPLVSRIIVPEQETGPISFRVPLAERQRLARDLAGSGEAIVAQVHSHPREAYHSPTDDADAIPRRVGSLSLVVPDYGARRDLLDGAALFELCAGGRWCRVPLQRLRLSNAAGVEDV